MPPGKRQSDPVSRGDIMQSLHRNAASAAAVIFLAFLIHNVNALYVEPT